MAMVRAIAEAAASCGAPEARMMPENPTSAERHEASNVMPQDSAMKKCMFPSCGVVSSTGLIALPFF